MVAQGLRLRSFASLRMTNAHSARAEGLQSATEVVLTLRSFGLLWTPQDDRSEKKRLSDSCCRDDLGGASSKPAPSQN
jgi:hypothetical protein